MNVHWCTLQADVMWQIIDHLICSWAMGWRQDIRIQKQCALVFHIVTLAMISIDHTYLLKHMQGSVPCSLTSFIPSGVNAYNIEGWDALSPPPPDRYIGGQLPPCSYSPAHGLPASFPSPMDPVRIMTVNHQPFLIHNIAIAIPFFYCRKNDWFTSNNCAH